MLYSSESPSDDAEAHVVAEHTGSERKREAVESWVV